MPEVYMKDVARSAQHDVSAVSVSDAENISCHAVSSAGADEVVPRLRVDLRFCVVNSNEILERLLVKGAKLAGLFVNRRDVFRLAHHLDQSYLIVSSNHLVGLHSEV